MEEETNSLDVTGDGEGLGFDPAELLAAAVEGRTEQVADDDEVSGDRPGSLAVLKPHVPRDMPKIDHLPDAVERDPMGNPFFLLSPGQRVVIERRASCLPKNPWLDTQLYEVLEVDQQVGLVKLWNLEMRYHARDNFRVGLSVGSKYKVPPAKGKWDAPPKVVPVPRPDAPPPVLNPDGSPVKRGRGRPPGVKNRPKEVIVAEKAAKAASKAGKRTSRRKGGV